MTHLDLFSGIGGFALAARWAGIETIAFCEIDKFCQKILNKNFPGVPIYEDIKELTWERFIADTTIRGLEKQGSGSELQPTKNIEILTGGFPCQPFSVAGKQRGKDDNRYLWPEMLRVIQEFHPTWIIGENVAGIINLALEQVCTDLEDSGYEVQPFIIPAVAVNAPHRRDRVWIVAYAAGDGGRGIAGEVCQKDGGQDGRMHIGAKDADLHATDTGWEHGESGNSEGMETNKTQWPTRPTDIERQDKDVTDTEAERLEGGDSTGNGCTGGRPPEHPWDRPWLEVAIETCSRDVRMDDGLPTGLDFSGYTKAGHRVERLKSLGNAIVPQIAYEIMKVMNRYKEER